MTTSTKTVSRHAHLYLGNPAEDPTPVFHDLLPDGVRLPNGTLVAWPEEAVFAVVFPPDTNRRFEGNRGKPMATFYDIEGWPVGFPAPPRSCFTQEARKALQSFPFTWVRWSPRELELCCSDGGQYLVRLVAQRRFASQLASMTAA